MRLECWTLGVVAGLSVGCATSASAGRAVAGKPVVTFPSSTELSTVAARAVQPTPPFQTVEVDSWTIQATVPAPRAPYSGATSWDELLAKLVAEQGGRITLSSALACAAQETARFYTQTGAHPGEGWQRFVVTRCGGTTPFPRLAVFGGPTPDETPEEDVQRKLGEKFPEFLKAQLPRGRGEVGLSYQRGNGRVVIAFYAADERARLDNFSPLVSGNQAVLEGELPDPGAFGFGVINQGKTGFAFCESDSAVQAPRFRLLCPVLETDSHARVDVAIRKPGQVLSDPVLSVLVRRREDAGLAYEPALPGDLKANVDEATFQSAVLAQVNELRKGAGLGALGLEPAQSSENARVAPHWFDAWFKGDDNAVQLLSMGLLAGWQVPGTIRDGGIYSGYLASTRSPERWLSDALASPLGRSVLLDPRAARVAIGGGMLGTTGIYAVATTYSFFDPQQQAAEESAVYDALSRVRKDRGLTPVRKIPRRPAMDVALQRIASGEQAPATAIQDALETVKSAEKRTVYGWALETNDLKQLKWSDKLLTPGLIDMSVGITHYKAPGGAWGQYVVLVMVFDNSEAKVRPGIEHEGQPAKMF